MASTESPRKTGFFVKIFRPALDAAEEGLTLFSARHGRLKLCIFNVRRQPRNRRIRPCRQPDGRERRRRPRRGKYDFDKA